MTGEDASGRARASEEGKNRQRTRARGPSRRRGASRKNRPRGRERRIFPLRPTLPERSLSVASRSDAGRDTSGRVGSVEATHRSRRRRRGRSPRLRRSRARGGRRAPRSSSREARPRAWASSWAGRRRRVGRWRRRRWTCGERGRGRSGGTGRGGEGGGERREASDRRRDTACSCARGRSASGLFEIVPPDDGFGQPRLFLGDSNLSNPPHCTSSIVAGARSVRAHFPRPSRRARPRRRPRPSFPLARAPDVLGRDVGPLLPHQGAQGSRARAAVARSPRRPILLSPARRRHPSEPSPPPARVVSALARPRAA